MYNAPGVTAGQQFVARLSTATIAAPGDCHVANRQRPGAELPPPTDASALPAPRLGEDRGRPALLVDGVVQSVAPAAAAGGYWAAMLPQQAPVQALVLGFGGGTIAHLLASRFSPRVIIGVDSDRAILALARVAFGQLPESVTLVQADARTFVYGCHGWCDYVAVDLFCGARVPPGVFARPFLRAVRASLTTRGEAAFNLFADQQTERRLSRLQAGFRRVEVERVGQNVIARCR